MSDARKVRKVLVVDDNRDLVRIIMAVLEREARGQYRYECTKAYDGAEALELVRAESPDMIITDNLMPRMDGFELLKNLQSSPETNRIPVMILLETEPGKGPDELLFKAWASGVSSALTKPVNPREVLVFVGRIFETLDEPEQEEAGTI